MNPAGRSQLTKCAMSLVILIFVVSNLASQNPYITESAEPFEDEYVIAPKYTLHHVYSEFFIEPLLDNPRLIWFAISDSLGKPLIKPATHGFITQGSFGRFKKILFNGNYLLGIGVPIKTGFNGRWMNQKLKENKPIPFSLPNQENKFKSIILNTEIVGESKKLHWPVITTSGFNQKSIYFSNTASIVWQGDLNHDGLFEYIIIDKNEESCLQDRIFLVSGTNSLASFSTYLWAKIDVPKEYCVDDISCRKFRFEMYAKAWTAEHRYKDVDQAIKYYDEAIKYFELNKCLELPEYQKMRQKIKELKEKK